MIRIPKAADKRRYKRLRRFNAVMAFFHFAQGLIMVCFSSDFRVPVTTSFLKLDLATFTLKPDLRTAFEVPLGPLIAGFLFMSALAHFLLTLGPIYRRYVAGLEKGINIARWIEYSLSSSLMMVAVGLLVGIYDGVTLMLMFALNAMMILFGWMMELHNQSTKRTNWTSYWFGVVAGAIPWVAVGLYLFLSGEGEYKAPTFVYWIFFSIFVFFNCFAVNMALQYKSIGRWKDYVYGEYAYIVLSLVAKSLLAWQVWAGTLRPV